MFREVESKDHAVLADYYNNNLVAKEKIWCASGKMTALDFKLHVMSLHLRGRAITQVHEEEGKIISYFGGYFRNNRVTFTVGIVNLALDTKDVWRRDAAEMFREALESNPEEVRIKLSDNQCWIVSWIEQEVGMTRYGTKNLWIASPEVIRKYEGMYR